MLQLEEHVDNTPQEDKEDTNPLPTDASASKQGDDVPGCSKDATRTRTLTDKGREYAGQRSHSKATVARRSLTKSVSKLLALLQDAELHVIKVEKRSVEADYKIFSKAHQDLIAQLSEIEDIDQANVAFADATSNYNKVMNAVGEVICRLETEEMDTISLSTRSTKRTSRSKRSSRSHRSNASVRQVLSDAAADRAEKAVELNYCNEENRLKAALAEQNKKNQELQAHAKAEWIRLQAELESKNRQLQSEIEEKTLKIEAEIKYLSLHRQRAKAEAREKVFAQFEENNDSVVEQKVVNVLRTPLQRVKADPCSSQGIPDKPQTMIESFQQDRPTNSSLNPNSASFIYTHGRDTSAPVNFQAVTEPNIAPTMATFPSAHTINIGQPSRPTPKARPVLPFEEPDVFSGDILDYPVWNSRFKELIETNVKDPSRLISYLNKYTSGEANESIRGFLVNPSHASYTEAKKILDDWYGDPATITRAYKKKLKAWPVISLLDGGKGIRSFSNFLTSCKQLITNSKFLSSLDDDDLIQELVTKLPKSSREEWSRITANCKSSMSLDHRSSMFVLFCQHVKKEAHVATQPVFGTAVLDQMVAENKKIRTPYKKKDFRSARSFTTSATDKLESEEFVTKTESESTRQVHCLFCNKMHELSKCSEFKEKQYQFKVEFIRQHRICFGCLKQNHISKNCRSRLRCEVCKKTHPTVLHSNESKKPKRQSSSDSRQNIAKSKNNEDGNCMMTGSSPMKSTRIVPVWIHHKDNPELEIKTYCALDEQSDCTFVSDQLRNELNVEAHKVNLKLTTMNDTKVISTYKLKGLRVKGLSGLNVELPSCYSRDKIPVNKDQVLPKSHIVQCPKYHEILNEFAEIDRSIEVGILIGTDCTKALTPIQVIADADSNSYAVRSILGWSVVGLPTTPLLDNKHCSRIETVNHNQFDIVPLCQSKELINPDIIIRCFEQDFSEMNSTTNIMSASLADKSISVEDKKFLKICEEGIRMTDQGQYELPLPFRHEPKISNNKSLAVHRLNSVKKKMDRDPKYKQDYCDFMSKIISKGHAVKVAPDDHGIPGRKWYLIHHGIYHPTKPNKIRVVYDGSALFQGESLNSILLPGPSLTNSIIGVLLRFRQGLYCFTADIEQMFYSVRLRSEYQDFFRFLWWEDGDTSKDAIEYRMTKHSFGVCSSPSCSIFALKKTAEDHVTEFGDKVAKVLISNSYVDDILSSSDTIEETVSLAKSSREMCQRGGFRLTKFSANKAEILNEIPVEERCSEIKSLEIGSDNLPVIRTLGVEWCIESDSFMFRVSVKERPFTRRGLLGTICSIFDPKGYLAPLVLEGKLILQSMVKDKRDWDEPLPDTIRPRWEKWISELPLISKLKIRRCFKPEGFGKVKKAELHHFSDGSNIAYGQCSYLRLINEEGKIHCCFVIGKSRVAPLKFMTVPRLELTAAVVSVRVGKMLQQELEFENLTETYWTDSSVVLGYIANESKRFHTYVANRVEEIRSRSQPKDWFHVKSKDNVSDDASRGLTAREMTDHCRYLIGPDFLWKPLPQDVADSNHFASLNSEDPEVRKGTVLSSKVKEVPSLLNKFDQFSSWYKLLRFVVIMRRFVQFWKIKVTAKQQNVNPNFEELKVSMSVDEISEAKSSVIKLVQRDAFSEDCKILDGCFDADGDPARRKVKLKKSSRIYRLHPFTDSTGVIRVGGRLGLSDLPIALKHPVIMPKGHHISKLLIQYYHKRSNHQGRGITQNTIRDAGFWIIGISKMISNHIAKCRTCRKLRGKAVEQKMADLPVDRTDIASQAPFTYCGMDLFGPWVIKQGRKEVKRYGVLFTCLTSRAIRIEVTPTLETDSFLNALRRFLCRNGPIRQIRCDRGSNFVGASRELRQAYESMNHEKIHCMLLNEDCDYFPFKFNAACASYQGGVWERQIRSARAVLSSLLMNNGQQLDEDSLHTFMVEAECIVNSRPLSVENLSNPEGPLPLSPHNILTMKTRLVLPPPGIFSKSDMYLKKRWRRVQHLANQFWQRWRKEYLQSLQERRIWNTTYRDLQVDDIVIVVDDNIPRNSWKLARVEEVYPNEDGHVRRVLCRIGDSSLDAKGRRTGNALLLERPIQKLILLMKAGEPG